jgi:hypothetical protein
LNYDRRQYAKGKQEVKELQEVNNVKDDLVLNIE